jgi:hypothetical protein
VIPAQADIDQALDVLDWCRLPAIAELRGHMSQLIRDVQQRRPLAASTDTTPADDWTPVGRALLYVLWVTSDEYLAGQFAIDPPTH